jgi:chlorophyll(ide) b reductase
VQKATVVLGLLGLTVCKEVLTTGGSSGGCVCSGTGADTKAAKFFINCLAEEPAHVASFLVPRIRRVPAESRTLAGSIAQGAYIKYLTKPKAYGQILTRLITGARKNRYVLEE